MAKTDPKEQKPVLAQQTKQPRPDAPKTPKKPLFTDFASI